MWSLVRADTKVRVLGGKNQGTTCYESDCALEEVQIMSFFFYQYEKSMHKSTFYKDFITVKYEVKDKSSSFYVLALDTGFNVLYWCYEYYQIYLTESYTKYGLYQ